MRWLVKNDVESNEHKLYSTTPPEVADHPLFSKGTVGIVTTDHPMFPTAPCFILMFSRYRSTSQFFLPNREGKYGWFSFLGNGSTICAEAACSLRCKRNFPFLAGGAGELQ